jgi:hypothetical protein
MKHLYRRLILEEKLSENSDFSKIQKLQQKLDSGIDITDSGINLSIEEFKANYVKPPELHKKCKGVMNYIGGNYIQMLSDGNYLLDYPDLKKKRSKKLEIVEKVLFKHLMSVN